jgi:murein peptide amidase A
MLSRLRRRAPWLASVLSLTAGVAWADPPANQYDWCAELAQSVPGITSARCMAAALQASDAKSVEGRMLLFRDIPPRSGPAKVKILVLGGIHGDELTSSTVVFDWIERLARENTEQIHWRLLPAVNADGLLKRPATRVNARGVDLNRNFPTDNWDKDAPRYWIKYTSRDPRRYPGPKPLSEPETRWVHAEMEAFKPDLIISVHAPFGLLDFDGPPPPPQRVGNLHLHQVGIYPGSLGNYGGIKKRMPVVTLELKHAAEAPSEKEMDLMWIDLTQWVDERLLKVQTASSKDPDPKPTGEPTRSP